MHDFRWYFSGFCRTEVIFQNFLGPGIFKKNPGLSRRRGNCGWIVCQWSKGSTVWRFDSSKVRQSDCANQGYRTFGLSSSHLVGVLHRGRWQWQQWYQCVSSCASWGAWLGWTTGYRRSTCTACHRCVDARGGQGRCSSRSLVRTRHTWTCARCREWTYDDGDWTSSTVVCRRPYSRGRRCHRGCADAASSCSGH